MINIALCGGFGRMGKAITELCMTDDEINLAYIIDTKEESLLGNIGIGVRLSDIIDFVDLIVDFTPAKSCLFNLKLAASKNKPFVTGTTGFSDQEFSEIKQLSEKNKIFYSPNYSIGVNVLFKLIQKACEYAENDYDIEIVEMHHKLKTDSPSGTALKINDIIKEKFQDHKTLYGRHGVNSLRKKNEITIHSLRGGDVIGDHTVIFSGNGERIEIAHKACSRKTFASGVLKAVKFLIKQDKNKLYGMDDMIN